MLHRQYPADEKGLIDVVDVIPAKAGIQSFKSLLDSRLRGSDSLFELSPVCYANALLICAYNCL
jgi:hypothetical protein